ncbi:MAG: 50S ribosomal protein L6 [Bacteroidota bacterium]
MSRVGRKPIPIVKGVTVAKQNGSVVVKGPKGELTATLHPTIAVEVQGSELILTRSSEEKFVRALHGLWRANLQNMVLGVTQGYRKKLEIVGVGYRAEMKGKKLHLQVGYSHPIVFGAPDGIKIEAPTQTSIVVSGIDKQLVGMVTAKIRSLKPPEPYKGKGIKYENEYIRRKAGKAAAATGTTK